MPKPDPLVHEVIDFERMRMLAALAPPTHFLRREVQESQWAHYGRAVYDHLHSDRFQKAVKLALKAADENRATDPLHMIASRLRAFLITGAL